MRKVLSLAHAAGVDQKDIHTSELRMQPEYSDEKIPRLLGYQVSQSVDITIHDLSKYESLMTQLLDAGVNRVDNVTFQLAETRKYKDEARLKAIGAAKEKASAMAAALGQTIGKPWEISEEIEAPQFATNAYTRRQNVVAEQQATIAAGQVTIRAFVRVSFQLE